MFRYVNFEDNYGREIVQEFATHKKGRSKTFLDIGAGEGVDLLHIKQLEPKSIFYAVESWEPNVKHLKANGVKVVAGDVERMTLPFEDNSIDVVICNQVLEHTKDLFWILHEIMRVLKKDGRLIVGVPNLAALHNRIMLALGITPECMTLNGAHVRGFTFTDLHRLMSRSPVAELVGRRGQGFYPFPRILARPLSKLMPGMSWGLFVCYRKTGKYRGEYLSVGAEYVGTSYYLGPHEEKIRSKVEHTILH